MTAAPMRTRRVLLSCLMASTPTTLFIHAQETPSDFGIFDWIHNAPGGYFNPKQEFRFETPGDSSTPAGVFAKQDIKKDEILLKVPWSLVLKSDDETEIGQMCCGTVEALAREMKLGADSQFAPYVQYLNAQPRGKLPSDWSEAGQNLLRQITGGTDVSDPEIPPAEPTEWLEYEWHKECKGDTTDDLKTKAALLVVELSDSYYMVPGYHLYNHRNFKEFMNTKTTTTHGEHHVTVAKRDIPAGTQIHISHNKCDECENRKLGYGTAEILRDYGFIERFPQTWHYMDGDMQFNLFENQGASFTLKWKNTAHRPDKDDYERSLVFLYRQIRRLRQVRNLSPFNTQLENIPQHELDLIWEFQKANIVAMNMAIEVIEIEFGVVNNDKAQFCTADGQCHGDVMLVNASHYDRLGPEFDDLDYSTPSCDNAELMDFNDYDAVDELKTNYQQLNFAMHPENGDICMDIEDIVQICSCYRPQYHEYMVHAAARYLDSVKRVIFIGGGDSMLLHETLKYPSLELVVGLELDQVVVQKSFKYFNTQPHYDDERVEWWFGDATKSLLLLQKEYWQSFDLVLVDLSETVMALSVTEELDVFDALGLLLKPDGVMVKNELYMEKFSEVFDYSTQIYYESPIICSQAQVMGSYSVDFLTAKLKDHEIDTLLYESLHTDENRFNFMHDYRKNDAAAQGKCGDLKIPEIPTEQKRAAGIVAIVNAEKTSVALDGSVIADKIRGVIEAEGFSLSSVPVFDNGSVYAIMKEGYIVVRLFPDEQYCAFDINLWGSFHKFKSLQTALVGAVGSTAVSSYRVVVGGMFGSSTWKEDQQLIGPQIVQTRNCEDAAVPDTSTTSEDMIGAALEESMALALRDSLKAVVFCGVEDKGKCLAADLLEDYEKISTMTTIWTCPGLDEEDVSEASMFECEYNTLTKLKSLVGAKAKTRMDLLVADATVPYRMLQILSSILGDAKERKYLIKKKNLFIALSTDPEGEEWRQHFLDRYRKQYLIDPVTRGHLLLRGGDANVGFGLVAGGDVAAGAKIASYADTLQKRFETTEKNVIVDLRTIHGGEFPFRDEWEPRKFKQSDYDNEPGKAQFMEQRALGRQNIFQLVPAEGVQDLEMSSSKLKDLLKWGLESAKLKILSHHESNDVGDGSVHIVVCKEGSVVGVWDGRNHVDINLFTYDEMVGTPKAFIEAVLTFLAETAVAALRDDQPRGVGRVVNFPSDM